MSFLLVDIDYDLTCIYIPVTINHISEIKLSATTFFLLNPDNYYCSKCDIHMWLNHRSYEELGD